MPNSGVDLIFQYIAQPCNLCNNGPATPERKANAKATSHHWVLILSSLPATPGRKITQLPATSQAKSL